MKSDADSVELPVRRRETVDATPVRRRALTVFCPVEERSIDPRTCARCDLCTGMSARLDATDASVRCVVPRRSDAPEVRPWFVGGGAIAARVPAGAVAGRLLVCARADAATGAVHEALEADHLAAALVVDDEDRPFALVARADLAPRLRGPIASVADLEVPMFRESEPLATVIAKMAYHRARFVGLVADDGRPTGLLTEIDVLDWIAHGGARR